jgi:hypothetical protein
MYQLNTKLFLLLNLFINIKASQINEQINNHVENNLEIDNSLIEEDSLIDKTKIYSAINYKINNESNESEFEDDKSEDLNIEEISSNSQFNIINNFNENLKLIAELDAEDLISIPTSSDEYVNVSENLSEGYINVVESEEKIINKILENNSPTKNKNKYIDIELSSNYKSNNSTTLKSNEDEEEKKQIDVKYEEIKEVEIKEVEIEEVEIEELELSNIINQNLNISSIEVNRLISVNNSFNNSFFNDLENSKEYEINEEPKINETNQLQENSFKKKISNDKLSNKIESLDEESFNNIKNNSIEEDFKNSNVYKKVEEVKIFNIDNNKLDDNKFKSTNNNPFFNDLENSKEYEINEESKIEEPKINETNQPSENSFKKKISNDKLSNKIENLNEKFYTIQENEKILLVNHDSSFDDLSIMENSILNKSNLNQSLLNASSILNRSCFSVNLNKKLKRIPYGSYGSMSTKSLEKTLKNVKKPFNQNNHNSSLIFIDIICDNDNNICDNDNKLTKNKNYLLNITENLQNTKYNLIEWMKFFYEKDTLSIKNKETFEIMFDIIRFEKISEEDKKNLNMTEFFLDFTSLLRNIINNETKIKFIFAYENDISNNLEFTPEEFNELIDNLKGLKVSLLLSNVTFNGELTQDDLDNFIKLNEDEPVLKIIVNHLSPTYLSDENVFIPYLIFRDNVNYLKQEEKKISINNFHVNSQVKKNEKYQDILLQKDIYLINSDIFMLLDIEIKLNVEESNKNLIKVIKDLKELSINNHLNEIRDFSIIGNMKHNEDQIEESSPVNIFYILDIISDSIKITNSIKIDNIYDFFQKDLVIKNNNEDLSLEKEITKKIINLNKNGAKTLYLSNSKFHMENIVDLLEHLKYSSIENIYFKNTFYFENTFEKDINLLSTLDTRNKYDEKIQIHISNKFNLLDIEIKLNEEEDNRSSVKKTKELSINNHLNEIRDFSIIGNMKHNEDKIEESSPVNILSILNKINDSIKITNSIKIDNIYDFFQQNLTIKNNNENVSLEEEITKQIINLNNNGAKTLYLSNSKFHMENIVDLLEHLENTSISNIYFKNTFKKDRSLLSTLNIKNKYDEKIQIHISNEEKTLANL